MLLAPCLNRTLVRINQIDFIFGFPSKVFFSVNMVNKFRRGWEVLDHKLSIHELFDVKDGDEDEVDIEISLTDLRSHEDQQKVWEEIGILNLSEEDVDEINNNVLLDDKVVDFVN